VVKSQSQARVSTGRSSNPRSQAAWVLSKVLGNGRSLDDTLARAPATGRGERDRALTRELCFGVLRWLPRLETVADMLLAKPLAKKHRDVYCLLLVGLYQLMELRVPTHAAVSETVAATRALKKPWAAGLINGTIRSYLRDQKRYDALAALDEVALAHPSWLQASVRAAWPLHWRGILEANNQRPPLWLRVNRNKEAVCAYLELLADVELCARRCIHAEHAVELIPAIAVNEIPGFSAGAVSVQDAAAQLAAPILEAEPGDRVLDACAAPGGKTTHILELYGGQIELLALDRAKDRTVLIAENIRRLGLEGAVLTADAASPDEWWDGRPFQRILLDAPCTSTGVIRRHPDIKWLRRAEDTEALALQQERLLNGLWPLLAPGGRLVYAICSVLPQEGLDQVERFVRNHADADERVINASWGQRCRYGRQIFPGEDGMDGFYYACLQKL